MSVHWGGRGFAHVSRTTFPGVFVGGGEPTGLNTPVLTWTSDTATYNPAFSLTEIVEGDVVEMQIDDNADFSSLYGDDTNTIDATEAGAGSITFPGIPTLLAGVTYYARARYTRGAATSAWSNTASLAMQGVPVNSVAPVVSGTATQGQTLSSTTGTWSNSPTSYAYQWQSSSGTYANISGATSSTYLLTVTEVGKTVRCVVTASNAGGAGTGTNSNATSSVVASTASPPAGSSLWLEAQDLSTQFQLITAATPVAADGDVVGTWQDKSGNSFHMAAAANDTTRPTYKVVGGKSFVRFDGVNDFLKRSSALGLYAAGSATVGFAVNANPAVDRTLFGVGSSGSNNPAYNFMSNNGTANRAAMRIENDTGVTVLPESSTMGSNAWNAVSHRVIFVDNGSSVTVYIDGVAQTAVTYTRTGTLTLNLTAIGAFARATPTGFFQADIAGIVAYPNATVSVSALDTYLASLI